LVWMIRFAALSMDRARDHALACSGFSRDEHGGSAFGRAFYKVPHLSKGCAVADEFGLPDALLRDSLKSRVIPKNLGNPNGTVQPSPQILRIHRLEKVII